MVYPAEQSEAQVVVGTEPETLLLEDDLRAFGPPSRRAVVCHRELLQSRDEAVTVERETTMSSLSLTRARRG